MFTPQEMRNKNQSRRIGPYPDVEVSASYFLQAIDVDVRLPHEDEKNHSSLKGYKVFGIGSAQKFLRKISQLGLRGVSVRLLDDPLSSLNEWPMYKNRWESALLTLARDARELDLEMIVDPFSIALQESGQWGLLDSDNHENTLILIGELAQLVENSGAKGMITLGRIPQEVQFARKYSSNSFELYSFSNNNETSTAYAGNLNKTVTGQKILPGNWEDMVFWSIMDIYHGSTFIITKPLENYHITQITRNTVKDAYLVNKFLLEYSKKNDFYLNEFEINSIKNILENVDIFVEKSRSVRFGSYVVSGTTQLLASYADSQGIEIARKRIEEMWINSIVAAGVGSVIIDRGAVDYFTGSILR